MASNRIAYNPELQAQVLEEEEEGVICQQAEEKSFNGVQQNLLSPLLLELQSLRTLIPPSVQVEESSTICVISDAVNYVDQLNRVLQSLKEGTQEFTSIKEYAGLVKLESTSNANVRILVHCKKKRCLLSQLVLALATQGVVVEEMELKCNNLFMMALITIQANDEINSESIRGALWKVVLEG